MPGPTKLRSDVGLLVGYAERDLAALWRAVSSAVEAEAALHDVLPGLIDAYGSAAATVAADWYDDLRAKSDVGRRFTAIPHDIRDTGSHALVGYALERSNTYGSFQALILGGMERRIANFARGTVIDSAIADPSASGWQRVGSGKCGFCDMLIGRGAVYSEAGADFASHDNCHCHAVPAFDGLPRPVKAYTPSKRRLQDDGQLRPISPADRERVSAYIESNT